MSVHSGGQIIANLSKAGKLAPQSAKIALAEWVTPGAQGPEPQYQAPLHVHHDDDEAWYVIEGRLRVLVAGEEYDVPAGSAIVGPHGLPHTFWNPDPDPVRYLLIMSAQTSDLLDALHSGEQLDEDQLRELFETYGAELLA